MDKTDKIAKRLIQEGEGYRGHVYLDTLGNPTTGWGHHLQEGSKVRKIVNMIFFKDDYTKAKKLTNRFLSDYNISLNPSRTAVLTVLIFNIGLGSYAKRTGLLGFHKMIAALQLCDFEEAGRQMENSKWYKQVGQRRADELVEIMISGEYNPSNKESSNA